MATPDPMSLYADTILVDGWCLRSALVRYAQAEPQRSTVLHALARRFDAALPTAPPDLRESLGDVLTSFDGLAMAMSTWASDPRAHDIPTPLVDSVCRDVSAVFERLGVPEESIDPAEWRAMRATEGRRTKAPSTPRS